MKLPILKAQTRLKSLSPSRYNMAVTCPARALWGRVLPPSGLPTSPAAVLGLAFHEVVEAVNLGRVSGDEAGIRAEAGRVFDLKAQTQMDAAHPLLRAKFPSPLRLPYYNQKRAGALMQAVRRTVPSAPTALSSGVAASFSSSSSEHGVGRIVEEKFYSRDGLLDGKPDCFETSTGLLIDYKSGAAPEGGGISPNEARQLRFYAHLLRENGHTPREAVIVRADGQEARLTISAQEAAEVGEDARRVLAQLNNTIDAAKRIEETATPSPQNCSRCMFVSICPAFWEAASPDWSNATANDGSAEIVHVEGAVISAASGGTRGGGLTTLQIDVRRGTGPRGAASLEQVPDSWLCCDGDVLPKVGDEVRVTGVALRPEAASPTVLRVGQTKAA
ncbi:MAG TPA: PD-(D/E)XK nuclease family protein, partial [Abditibacterium sp.]